MCDKVANVLKMSVFLFWVFLGVCYSCLFGFGKFRVRCLCVFCICFLSSFFFFLFMVFVCTCWIVFGVHFLMFFGLFRFSFIVRSWLLLVCYCFLFVSVGVGFVLVFNCVCFLGPGEVFCSALCVCWSVVICVVLFVLFLFFFRLCLFLSVCFRTLFPCISSVILIDC